MYDSDPADITEIGWERFITGAWTNLFASYQSPLCGIRSIGRQWSDLLQAGLDCSQELADELVAAEVIRREDRDLMIIEDPDELLAAMDEVLADMGAGLAGLPGIGATDRDRLAAAHRELRVLLREFTAAEVVPDAAL